MRNGLSVRDSSPGIRLRLTTLLPVLTFFAVLIPAGANWLVSRFSESHVLGLAVSALCAVVCAGFAVLVARRLARKMEFYTEIASRLAGPGRNVLVPEDGPPELRRLGRALNRLSRDITAERRRFANAERRYRTLIETMSEGFVIVDPGEKIVYANRRFGEMVGVPPEDLVGSRVFDFLDDTNRMRLSQQSGVRQRGIPGQYELDWTRPDGTIRTSLVSAAALCDADGALTGSFAVITDMTERRRLEEQMSRAERLRALGQLAGGIAHDFNNRLTAILGNAQLLLLDAREDSLVTALTTIEQAALEGAETVRRVMEFTRTRPDAAKESIEPAPFLAEVLGLLRFRWKDEADEGGYSYRILEDHRATRRISGYPTELREALLNVLNNALDAMPSGGELRITSYDLPDSVGIRIADSGHGMSKDALERICDPFFTTRGLNATGLGLSITYGIISRHGGELSIRSAEDQGTTVTISLPNADAGAPEKPTDALTGPRPDQTCARILVVEDEVGIARLIQMTLERSGHIVEMVTSGEDALEVLRAGRRFDVVVTDLGMPGVPGYRVAEEAAALLPDAKVVVITGWGAEAEEDLTDLSAVDLVVRKPFSVSDLVEKVDRVICPADVEPGYAEVGRSGPGDRGGSSVEESPGTSGQGGG